MDQDLVIRRRVIRPVDLVIIRQLIEAEGAQGRSHLSNRLCELWDWRQAKGRYRQIACRELLRRLHAKGLIQLPPPLRAARRAGYRNTTRLPELGDAVALAGPLAEFRSQLKLNLVRGAAHARVFAGLIGAYHYLGYQQATGAQLKYLVWYADRPIVCLSFGPAAWKLAPRDHYIGWSAQVRQARLDWVVNNDRFLIVPGVQIRHLASYVLGATWRRLRADWQAVYGHDLALAGYVKSKLQVSYTGVAGLFDTVLGLPVCRGYVAKVLQKVSQAVTHPVNELVEALPLQRWLNVDETGHKDQGQGFWTWCFRAQHFVGFRIAARRSSAVLLEVLGREFNGVLGCDFFSAYRKYMGQGSGLVQFCLAHLIRELKFLAEHPDQMVRACGQEVLGAVRRLVKVIHQKDELSAAEFEAALAKARRLLVRAATETDGLSPFKWVRQTIPEYRIIETMADRFRRYGEQYFTFITTPGVEPTNNSAEQAIRFVVIDRRVTQGTRGQKGQRYCERLWTVIGTCALQSRSIFDYWVQAVTAYFEGKTPPSLLPADTS